MGTGSFPEVESGRGVTLTPSIAEVQKRSRDILPLSLRAFVACVKGEILKNSSILRPQNMAKFRDLPTLLT
jgi:hypothetical protein